MNKERIIKVLSEECRSGLALGVDKDGGNYSLAMFGNLVECKGLLIKALNRLRDMEGSSDGPKEIGG